ncbi:RNA-binding domain-containing protein [Marasmius fiardii PR-910]|nr:RNA-binding domain-containing protein [Marasmius fiardii PR-910]
MKNDEASVGKARRSASPQRREEDEEERSEHRDNQGNNLHIKGLSRRVDDRDLLDAFSKVGRVQKARVIYDPHTRESRGFGFVTMESPEEAVAAVTVLNATELMGKVITVEKARRGRARTPTPGKYYGPPRKPGYQERQYDPIPYDSRYGEDSKRERGRYRDWRNDDDFDDRRRDYRRRGSEDRDRRR